MKCGNSSDTVHTDVVIIGNGPSGISLSYMLDGNIPYVTSSSHPDEFLSARLAPVVGESLVGQDLGHLAAGLEGRTTNPISLLLDCLIHPCADIGLELDPLVEWRKNGAKIDHVVLGKGPPGGSWHSMDPQVLTLSLGTWMALPGLKYKSRDGSEKRASAKNVAEYYVNYVHEMGLAQYFKNNVIVSKVRPYVEETKNCWVRKVNNDIVQRIKLCMRPESKDLKKIRSTCTLSHAFNFILKGKLDRPCRRNREIQASVSPERKIQEILQDNACCEERLFAKPLIRKRDRDRSSESEINCDRFYEPRVPSKQKNCDQSGWIVETIDIATRRCVKYVCKYLVLANGSSDLPNRLGISNIKTDPYWLLHDLRSLEIELDLYLQMERNPDPVLVVGAGLSAADAIIASRGRNVPVLHVYRNQAVNISKQLPENMYPEYHKVHQMMKDGSNYDLYTALPEYELVDVNESTRTVSLISKEGKRVDMKVSYTVVLIGSRPDLTFLPEHYNIATKKHLPVDCKKNTININRISHSLQGHDKLYAVGPLTGDNFVRFLPGGALAVLCDLYKKYSF